MSKISLIIVSIAMVGLLGCSAPDPAPAPTAVPTPVPMPTPKPTATPEPVVVCVPEVVDYVTEMVEEVESVIEAGEELDVLLDDPSDDILWKAKVAKELLNIGGAVNTIASTTPPEPIPTVYEEIKNLTPYFERVLESIDASSVDAADKEVKEALVLLRQAIGEAVKSQDFIIEWLGNCN